MIDQVWQFIQAHWLLCSATVVVVGALVWEELSGRLAGVVRISAQSSILLMNRKKARVIDVRERVAFDRGHIIGAINLAANEIVPGLDKLKINLDDPLILVDQDGTKVASIANQLQKAKYVQIYLLERGMAGWQEVQLPLERC